MTVTSRTYTAEELFAMPENGGRNELLDGELLPMSPIGLRHMQVTAQILFLLQQFLKQNPIGIAGTELGCILARNPDVLLAPDVGFVNFDRIGRGVLPETFFDGAPDLAVEVLSPSDSWQEVETKATKYIENGTPLVWIVNPKTESVTIYQPGPAINYLKSGDKITGENVLPGFSCNVSEFFAAGM